MRSIFIILTLSLWAASGSAKTPLLSTNIAPLRSINIEKALLYDTHTLDDTYPYKDTVRMFQWVKIYDKLDFLDSIQNVNSSWAVLRNKRNINGIAPIARNTDRNEYNTIVDQHGVERRQSIPLYYPHDTQVPERYAKDGALMRVIADSADFVRMECTTFGGEWMVPAQFVRKMDTERFSKVIFVDRNNQNITTIEKEGDKWLIRSMNPATTGLKNPPYQYATPLGIFVVQEKREKMIYNVDGTNDPGGFAPHASRFCQGAFIHGIPINLPHTQTVEISASLGTTPRSHMCVRNATSHAEFIYDWAPVFESLVVVIE